MAEPSRNRPRGRKESCMRVTDPDALLRARHLKGWSQRQMASLCRCSQQTIHRVEIGKRGTVNTAVAKSWAHELDLPLEAVFEEPSYIVAHEDAIRSATILSAGATR